MRTHRPGQNLKTMAKIMKSFRLDDSVIEQLELLSEDLGISQAEILSKGVAIISEQNSDKWSMTPERAEMMQHAIDHISIAIQDKNITYNMLQVLIENLDRVFNKYIPQQ